MGLLDGKKALIFGVANNKSIAYAIAKNFIEQGAEVAFSYAGEKLKTRVEKVSEELGGKFLVPCDVTSDHEIEACFETVKKEWGTFDILVHSVAYAPSDALKGRYVDTQRAHFAMALDISVYSLVAVAKAAEPILNDGGSVITMSYLGAERVIRNYNVMGVAKAALESTAKYLALDMGERKIRVNAISAGPIKTLAAAGISDFKKIFNHIAENAPLRDNCTQDDVGRTAVYLASELSTAVTGEVIHVDNGYSIMGL
ncbi:short-chain dehydrogenase/reductase SDR [Denitrovibrio acetiphilus DSM 12809]|uniref:Enoyl-[acyl-carrier-protein] reductase [NADH] n=1 Tax=Denitrovibrio acetiphilus (strain DSM 12809 / NBRC 114555 / N2460) TaxID=522772 RepID=D4H6I0_DENA2|nr:enoyl-ACP reductase [Denitrovibrio acetiphilus]ADD69654.1 short-chain dehydrogenase/reductase SDR [Denitrovibrio acetiphilus DSM 12809]